MLHKQTIETLASSVHCTPLLSYLCHAFSMRLETCDARIEHQAPIVLWSHFGREDTGLDPSHHPPEFFELLECKRPELRMQG